MYKLRILVALMLVLAMVSSADARQVKKEILAETTLTVADNGTTETAITFVGNSARAGFFVNYTESQNTMVQLSMVMYISYDNSNWTRASWYDYTGGATLQTEETITSSQWYYCWWNKDITAPFVKLSFTPYLGTAADRIAVTVYSVLDK